MAGCSLPLENGDRLTRDEFERRYDAMPGLKKAELIEGSRLHALAGPTRAAQPARIPVCPGWGHYEAGTPGVEAGDNGSVRLDLDNEPQPDAFLIIQPECGGQARISEDDYIEGAPELVAEVASSSVSYDLGRSSRSTAATASASTWSGGCSTARSTGSSSARAATSRSPRGRRDPAAAPSSPASGSTLPRSWRAISPACSRSFQQGLQVPGARRFRRPPEAVEA